MNSALLKQAEDLFEELADVPAGERRQVLDARCGEDKRLRWLVEQLLSSHDAGLGAFMMQPVFTPPPDAEATAAPGMPSRIGPYEIVRIVGEGGMGAVYEARQQNPHRTVALKVVKPGIGSREMLRRFEHEADVLGRLQHPGIAHIYEAGRTEIGTPDGRTLLQHYFVMEYIEGVSLTRYVRDRDLGTRQRLEVFSRICDAVEHAHQRGIIHRDLKPANILVTDDGQPKVLDFGVARATDVDMQTVTLQTRVGQLVGTLAYMSPEQVMGDPSLLDARSDVYSLGVILFELLAGELPYVLQGRPIPEAVGIIRDQDPTSLGSLNSSFRGDLDTVVATALSKDRQRRYSSAAALAADVRRFLADVPIAARPPTTLYQLGKFAKRHKGLVAGLAIAFLALAGGLVGTSLAMIEASRQRDDAVTASHEAELARAAESRQRAAAEESEKEARREAIRANTVAGLLEHMLSSADPSVVKGREYTVRELLDAFSADLPHLLDDQPIVESDVRSTIGKAYLGLAEFDRARSHLVAAEKLRRSEFGEVHHKVAASLLDLARLSYYEGDFGQAESLARHAVDIQRQLPAGPNNDSAASVGLLAETLQQKGEYAKAEDLFNQALNMRRQAFGEDSLAVAASMHDLALLLDHRGRTAEAEPLYRRSLEIQRKLGNVETAEYAKCLFDLASSLLSQGATDEVELLYVQALDLNRKLFGDRHPAVAGSLLGLASLFKGRGDLAGSEQANREALEIYRGNYGDEHPSVSLAMNNLAGALKEQGKFAQAEQLYRQALTIQRKVYGNEHPAVVNSLSNLAALLKAIGQYEQSEQYYTESLNVAQRVLSPGHPTVGYLHLGLADLFFVQGCYSAGEGEFRSSLSILEKALPPAHPGIMDARIRLGECLLALGQFDEARSKFTSGYEGMANALGPESPRAQRAVAALIKLFEATGDKSRAATWRQKLRDKPESASMP